MAKRKRVSDVTTELAIDNSSPYPAGPSIPSTAGPSKTRPTIQFNLAQGDKSYQVRLGHKRRLDDYIPEIIQNLGVDAKPQQVRLSHVRDGGKEVDMWDEYDFVGFKKRAFSFPSQIQLIKVHLSPSSLQHAQTRTTPTPVPAMQYPYTPSPASLVKTPQTIMYETPVGQEKKGRNKKDPKGKQKANVQPPSRGDQALPAPPTGTELGTDHTSVASVTEQDLPVAGPSTTNTIAGSSTPSKSTTPKARKRKREISAGPTSTPTTPAGPTSDAATSDPLAEPTNPPAVNQASTPTPKRRRNKKAKIPAAGEPGSVPPSPAITITAASPTVAASHPDPHAFVNKYKPAISSPLAYVLGPARGPAPASTTEVEASTPKKVRNKTKKKKDAEQAPPTPVETTPVAKVVEEQTAGQEEVPGDKGAEESTVEVVGAPAVKAAARNKPKKKKAAGKVLPAPVEVTPVVEVAKEQSAEQEEVPLNAEADKSTVEAGHASAVEAATVEAVDAEPRSERLSRPLSESILVSEPHILNDRPRDPDPATVSRWGSSAIHRLEGAVETIEVPEHAIVSEDELEEEEAAASPRQKSGPRDIPDEDEERPPVPETPAAVVEDVTELQAEPTDEPAPGPQPASDPQPVSDAPVPAKPMKKPRKSKGTSAAAEIMTAHRAMLAAREAAEDAGQGDGQVKVPQPEEAVTVESAPEPQVLSEPTGSGPVVPEVEALATALPPTGTKRNRQVSQPIAPTKLRSYIPSEHHVQLASRGQCIICSGPSHLQKDCPKVQEGLESLQDVLEEKKAGKKTALREASIEAIEMWINRLGRIANSVKGVATSTPSGIKPLAVVPIVPSPTIPPAHTEAVKASAPAPQPIEADSVTPPTSPEPEPAATPTRLRTAAHNVGTESPIREHSLPPIHLKALARKAGSISGLSVSDAVIETGSSASESDSEDESGSGSGSGSGSDSGSDSDGESDEEVSPSKASQSRSRSSSATSSTTSEISPARRLSGFDLSNLAPQATLEDFLKAPLSQKQKRSVRLSAAAMANVDLDGEAQDVSDIESSPEPQLPPSAFARGRRGSESSVGEFEEDGNAPSEEGKDEDEVLPFSQPPSVLPSQAQDETIESQELPREPTDEQEQQQTQEIPVPGSETSGHSRRSFADLAVQSSPIIGNFPGSIALQEAIDEDQVPERLLDLHPDDQDQDQDQDQEQSHAKSGHVISQGLMSPPSSAAGDMQHADVDPEVMPGTQLVNADGDDGPDGEAREDQDATPRPLKRRVTRGMASTDPESSDPPLGPAINIQLNGARSGPSSSQLPVSVPAPASPPRRRLRSMSRELTAEPMSPRMTTRRVSSSQPVPSSRRQRSQSPSASQPAPFRRGTRRTTPLQSSQVDELPSSPAAAAAPSQSLRRSSRRGTTPLRSSQVDQLESSPPPDSVRAPAPIPEEEEEEAGSEADEAAHQSPDGLKTPLVPETQLDPETEPDSATQSIGSSQSRRSSLRIRPAPLFFSQGSQIPQTQAYNLYPAHGSSSEIGVGETPRGKTGAVASSPASERRVNGHGTARTVSMRMTSPIAEEEENEPALAAGPESNGHPKNGDESVRVPESSKGGDSSGSDSGSESDDDGNGPSLSLPPLRTLRHSTSTPNLYPPLPLPLSASHPARNGGAAASQPQAHMSSIPTLSSLNMDMLRNRTKDKGRHSIGPGTGLGSSAGSGPGFGISASQPAPTKKGRAGRASMPASQPARVRGFAGAGVSAGRARLNGASAGADSSESDSGSGSDSSNEEDTPAALKGRTARGKVQRRSSQPARVGW